jgi:YlmC/YmxH family sporulation protein
MGCCRIVDMRHKQVINVKDGTCLGCVCDVEVDTACAKLVAIVIYGRLKCFGLFGREDDIIIKWEDIQVIGEDTILVNFNIRYRQKKRGRFFNNLFGN